MTDPRVKDTKSFSSIILTAGLTFLNIFNLPCYIQTLVKIAEQNKKFNVKAFSPPLSGSHKAQLYPYCFVCNLQIQQMSMNNEPRTGLVIDPDSIQLCSCQQRWI